MPTCCMLFCVFGQLSLLKRELSTGWPSQRLVTASYGRELVTYLLWIDQRLLTQSRRSV